MWYNLFMNKRGRPPRPPMDRFMEKVVIMDGHWFWTGAITPTGRRTNGTYSNWVPYFFNGKKLEPARRFIYRMVQHDFELAPFDEPTSEIWCWCEMRTGCCVNPHHLVPRTRRERYPADTAAERRRRAQKKYRERLRHCRECGVEVERQHLFCVPCLSMLLGKERDGSDERT